MIRSARSGDTDREIERRVHVWTGRQSLLTQDDPTDPRVVLIKRCRAGGSAATTSRVINCWE
jgi:hypothetical protein